MNPAFGKLYEQTFTGSMAGAGAVVFSVWAYVVAHLRPPGIVELNPLILAAAIGVDRAEVERAIEYLSSPDEMSRTKEHEGRRLLKEGQFLYRAPNFDRYRNGNDEQRKIAAAARQAKYRNKKAKRKRDVVMDINGQKITFCDKRPTSTLCPVPPPEHSESMEERF